MSNKNNSQPAVHEPFAIEMPDEAPALGFDPMSEGFSWQEVYPSNYWNMERLDERKQQLGGWPVLTPARIVIKPVYDPSEFDGRTPPPEALAPRIVLEFAESVPALVFNASRCEIASKITGTPNPQKWATLLPPLMVSNGIYNKKAQIVFELAPTVAPPARPLSDEEAERVNEELFG
ncbi:MAG: hypothetical protein KF770_14465 [Anaerolineae bacterium]|nr:hypothetical protein [Anaerolineae bacterium]